MSDLGAGSRRLLRGSAVGGAALEVPLRAVRPALVGAGAGPEALLAAAHAEADRILAEAEERRLVASETGYLDGLEAAREEAMAEVQAALAAVAELGRSLQARLAAIEEAAAEAAAALALEVAARLVRAEVAARPERVLDVVRGAIRRAADRERLVARVNPADLEICRAAVETMLREIGGIRHLDVFDDARVPRGSCILETDSGDVDATVESQFARIQEALFAPPDEDLVIQ